MSLGNWILDHTVGPYYDYFSNGKLNPWKLADIEEQGRRDEARASGVGVGGQTVVASPEVVRQRQDAVVALINNYLRSQNQHPDQADWESGKKKALMWLAVAGSAVVAVWVLTQFGKAYISKRG